MLLVAFLFFIFNRESFLSRLRRPVLQGILSGVLLATRGLVIIPLIICFTMPVFAAPKRKGIVFIAAALFSFCAVLIPFILWNPKLFLTHNPLILQTNKAPFIVQAAAIAGSFLLAFRVKGPADIFAYSGMVIFAVMACSFVHTGIQRGFIDTLYKPYFDISYFNTALPFVIVAIALTRENAGVASTE
jgi:hypothetical protein